MLTKNHRGFTMIEMLAVLAVIGILAVMAIPSLQEKIIRDQVIEALAIADVAKAPVALSWGLTQTMPADNGAAGLPAADKIVGNYVSSTKIEGGAIQITLGNRANNSINGKVVSLRPAVVADAPIVPVAWVCGNATVPDKMTVKGPNRTDIPNILLPVRCRP